MADYLRLTHAAPQPTVPLQEVGLKTLSSLTSALVRADPATSAPVVAAVAKLLDNVAPLRMFGDVSPARSSPEAPLVISPSQVSADSTRGEQYAVSTVLALDPTTVDAKKFWCSKARPQHNKSSITLYFTQPEQLTGIHLRLPEAKYQSELVGLEVLRAPDDVDTPAEIAEFVHSSKASWTVLGVLPPANANGRRLPITAHHAVGLRISFKGFAKPNTDKYHALAGAVVYAATSRLFAHKACAGMGGSAPHTDTTSLLFGLNKWLKNTASTAASASGAASSASEAAVCASLRALASLSLSTGSLASLMALTEALVKHDKPLPAPTAAHLRAVLGRVSSIGYERVALSTLAALNAGSSGSGAGSGVNPDKFSEAKFTDKSTYVDIKDGDVAHRVRSTSSPEYAALNIGISSGVLVWEMKIEEDSHGGECQCFGLIRKPISSYSYDGSNDMWMWRAFNGYLYSQGSQTGTKERFHQGEIVKFELNMDTGECKGWVNGRDQGVLWTGLNTKGTLYPAAQFYSSGRECSLVSIQLHDASTAGFSGGEGGGAGGASVPSKWVADLDAEEAVTATPGTAPAPFTTVIAPGSTIGYGASLGCDLPIAAPEEGTTQKAPVPRPASLHGVPVSHGVSTQLLTDKAGGLTRVAYSLLKPDESKSSTGKKGPKEHPYTVFEAVVGLADFIAPQGTGTGKAASSSATGGAASSSSSSSSDASDSKEAPSVDQDSKEAETTAQAAPSTSAGVAESKEGEEAASSSSASGSVTSVTLRVLADGKPVWESPRPIRIPSAGLPATAAAHASLPVFHVTAPLTPTTAKLELEAVTDGPTNGNAWVCWGDARLRGASYALDRASVERELADSLPADYKAARAAAAAAGGSAAATVASSSSSAAFSPLTAPYPLLAAVSGGKEAPYTAELLSQASLTGPEAATATLRILRLLAREAYKPVRISTPPAPFGTESPIALEVPFAVQAHGKVMVDAAAIIRSSLDALKAAGASSASASVHNEIIAAVLMIVKGNLRRLTATRVLPSDVGIILAGEDAATRATEGKATPKHLVGKPEEAYGPTLAPLLEVLTSLMSSGAETVWPEVAAEAASVIDTGLPLFYPTQASQAAFLSAVLGTGTGGILEVHFPWPTLLKHSDKRASQAIKELHAAGKASAHPSKDAAGGAKDGGAAGGLTGPAKHALEDLAKGKGALSVLNDGSDPRFERAILGLQALATARGWAHTTVGVWGHSLHLVAHVPDTAAAPIARTLGSDLASVFASAGIPGWSFPQGVATPEITFKVERFLRFNRRERLATDPGIAWVRLYPTSVAPTLESVVAEVRAFISDQQRAAAADAAASTGGAASEGKDKDGKEKEEKDGKKEGHGKRDKAAAAAVVDVFGDAVHDGEGGDDAASVHTSGGGGAASDSSSESGSGTDDDGDDDDGEEEEEEEDSHYSDEE